MPAPSATAKCRMGLWGVAFPYINQSPAGKTPAVPTGTTVSPRIEDERLVRPAGKLA